MNSQLASVATSGILGILNDTSSGGASENVSQFGFNPRHGLEDGTAAPEDVATVDQTFYTTSADNTTSAYTQTLDSRTMRNVKAGLNTMSFRFSETGPDGGDLANFFSATMPLAPIPYYRLHHLKFENANPFNGSNYENLAPAVDVTVNAFVYAQNGSWLIVPGSFYDDNVVNYNTASYSAKNDFNRDGIISRGERIGAYRYHRYNYRINFTGAICENRTAPVFDSGTVKGLVSQWMDKWTTVSTSAANWVTPTAIDNKYQNISFVNGNINNINYAFDASLASGDLDDDTGFQLPVQSGWLGEQ